MTIESGSEPLAIRPPRAAKHPNGKDGSCSLCGTPETPKRRGSRIGVKVASKKGYLWICPECARAIARVA